MIRPISPASPIYTPSYAGRRNGAYEPQTNAYNIKGSNLRRIRAALAGTYLGVGTTHIMCGPADSETDRVADSSNDQLNMWHQQFGTIANAKGYARGGDGLIKFGELGGGADARTVFAGGWTRDQFQASVAATGATIVTTFAYACTNVDVTYYGDTQAFTVKIDGGAAVPITPTGTPNVVERYAVTGLANALHVVTITTTTAAASSKAIAVVGWSPNKLNIHNCGVAGTSLTNWANRTAPYDNVGLWNSYRSSLPAVPDLLASECGVNDITSGFTPAATVTAWNKVLDWNAGASDVLLIGQVMQGGLTQAAWERWLAAMYTMADTRGVPMVDLYDMVGGPYATAAALGYMYDVTHPNRRFQAVQADRLADLLL